MSVSISASPTNIAAAGGSSTITCSAVRSRQYTWNGIGQNFPETENGSLIVIILLVLLLIQLLLYLLYYVNLL